jgi:hypothetical protein
MPILQIDNEAIAIIRDDLAIRARSPAKNGYRYENETVYWR